MGYLSTRDSTKTVSASKAILEGLCPDGGLFLPDAIPSLSYASLLGKSYPDIVYSVLRLYLDDYTDEEIRQAVDAAYSKERFPEQIYGVASFGPLSFLELFHGPTLTFKDMALSVFPFLLEDALKKHPEQQASAF
jgi:threonine synthase